MSQQRVANIGSQYFDTRTDLRVAITALESFAFLDVRVGLSTGSVENSRQVRAQSIPQTSMTRTHRDRLKHSIAPPRALCSLSPMRREILPTKEAAALPDDRAAHRRESHPDETCD